MHPTADTPLIINSNRAGRRVRPGVRSLLMTASPVQSEFADPIATHIGREDNPEFWNTVFETLLRDLGSVLGSHADRCNPVNSTLRRLYHGKFMACSNAF